MKLTSKQLQAVIAYSKEPKSCSGISCPNCALFVTVQGYQKCLFFIENRQAFCKLNYSQCSGCPINQYHQISERAYKFCWQVAQDLLKHIVHEID